MSGSGDRQGWQTDVVVLGGLIVSIMEVAHKVKKPKLSITDFQGDLIHSSHQCCAGHQMMLMRLYCETKPSARLQLKRVSNYRRSLGLLVT